MATIHGQVSETGVAEINGTKFKSTKLEKGRYEVAFQPSPFSESPVVVATPISLNNSATGTGGRDFLTVTSWSASRFTIAIKRENENANDQGFNFVAIGA